MNKWRNRRSEAEVKDMRKINEVSNLLPVNDKELTDKQLKDAINYIYIFLKENRWAY